MHSQETRRNLNILSTYLFKFGKRKSLIGYDQSNLSPTISRRKTEPNQPVLRLNRMYLVYLRLARSTITSGESKLKTKMQNISTKSKYRKICRASIRKMKMFSTPDPWTTQIRRKLKQLLCQGCRKYHLLCDVSIL